MRLRDAALGIAVGEAVNSVREEGGENRGEKVTRYLSNAGVPVPAPWCAAFVQWITDGAARYLFVDNPLDDVNREALVADYASLAEERDWVVGPELAAPGDLVLFRFGRDAGRWNHMGILEEELRYVVDGSERAFDRFHTVEGNTSPGVGVSDAEREREGDGVYRKRRRFREGRTLFISWDEMRHG